MKKRRVPIMVLLIWIGLLAYPLFAESFQTAKITNYRIGSTETIDAGIVKNSPLPSSLNRLYSLYQQKKNYKEYAAQAKINLEDEKVIVTILNRTGQMTSNANQQLFQQFGATIQAQAKHSMRVAIPISQLENAAQAFNSTGTIHQQIRPVFDAVTSEGVALMNADTWQTNGHEGAGVKVAIIDGGFEKLDDAVTNGDIPADYVGVDFSGSGLQSESDHGTAVAEAVHDVAPAASLYLYHISDLTDLENAKDEAITQGVHVINHSMSWFLQSYYDGTGPVNDIANDANSNGITWTNSASNSAEKHYRSIFTPMADDYHDFTGSGGKLNTMGPEPGRVWLFPKFYIIQAWLNWDAYPATEQDYDFYLYKWNYSSEEWQEVSSSKNRQTGAEEPTESIAYLNTETDGRYAFAVHKYAATVNVDFTIFAGYGISYHQAAGSVTDPASAAGVVTVGAIARDSYAAGPVEPFSGQGPTNDGRPKPDVTAPDSCDSFTYGHWQGTSLSAPHTAGVCALIQGRFPGYTNAQVKDYLFNNCTEDLGAPGRDDTYGWGKVVLPNFEDISVTVPNGAEDWKIGTTQDITWFSNGTSGTVDIEYSTNGGTHWSSIITGTTDDGSHSWVIPDAPSTDCLVKVTDNDGTPTDQSDAAFTISYITYTLTMAVNPAGAGTTDPAAGDHIYNSGTVVNISATAATGYEFSNWTGDVADANSAATTVTMDADETVTANFSQLAIDINDLCASVQGENILLEWTGADGFTEYNVYRDTTYDFEPDFAGGTNRIAAAISDEDGTTAGIQWTDTGNGADVVGDTLKNYFYRVTGILTEESTPSNLAGEFDYSLLTTSGTDINELVVLWNTQPGRTPILTAEDLAHAIPYCTDVYRWDAAGQGTVGHPINTPIQNFDIIPGYPYIVNVSSDTIWTVAGAYADTSFDLITTSGTDINHVNLPLKKNTITNAEELAHDIPNCTDVYYWNTLGQGTVGHPINTPIENFEVTQGFPYYVNVTVPVTWPEPVITQGIISKPVTIKNIAASVKIGMVGGGGVPHTVYGQLTFAENMPELKNRLQLRTWIHDRPEEILTSNKIGTGIDGKNWWVGVSDFPGGWKIGDILHVEITNPATDFSGKGQIVLTGAGSDNAGEIKLSSTTSIAGRSGSNIPEKFVLMPNYPNPFNPETQIKYGIPQSSPVKIQIFDLSGRLVQTLVNSNQNAGYHRAVWNGRSSSGKLVSSGIYFCRLDANGFRHQIKLVLQK